jgi:hypothetical protein
MITTVSAKALGLLDVVRRHEDRDALAAQAVDERPQSWAHLRVEADVGSSMQQQPRSVDKRAGDEQPPPHAARQIVDLRVTAIAEVRDRDRRSIAARRSPRGTRYRCAKTSRFCSTVSVMSRLSSWGTTPHSARADLRVARQVKPSTSISPSSAIACAVSSRIVVDLPAPFGPSRPTHVPSGTSRSSRRRR